MKNLKPQWIDGSLCYELPVMLAADTTILLRRLSERRGDPANETIRRALSVLNFVENEIAQGKKIIVAEPEPARWWRRWQGIHARQVRLIG
jgi:hypothetical protein